jgi:glycosyltransferase involved in cell wall biosynthesis
MMPRCSAVISPSPPLVKELQRFYGGPTAALVRNIPPYQPPVSSDRLRRYLNLDPKVRIALYQGSLGNDRGLDILVRAARFLDPDIVIALMGKGESQAVLEALITREGVGDRVKFVPPVPYVELLNWTASADIGLIIYRPQSANVPMMLPNKLFEYLMAGVPVLASPLEAVVDIINTYEVGSIVRSLDPEEVGHAMSALLADHKALGRMRRNALAACQRELRWDVESQQLIQLYQDVPGISRGCSAQIQ